MHFNRQLVRSAKNRPVQNSMRLGSAGRSVGLALRELNSCRDYTERKSRLDQLLEELEAVEKKQSNLL